MSTVAHSIKDELEKKSGIKSTILNIVDFYVPIRGNMRRNRTRSANLEENKEDI